jgi:hypothetical protein
MGATTSSVSSTDSPRTIQSYASLGANAVTNVICESGGFSLTKHCVQYFQCVGDAVTWN